MQKIKVVFWDVDATLLDQTVPEQNAIRNCFSDFGFGECTDQMLSLYPAINNKWWDKLGTDGFTKQIITVERFREFLDVLGLDSSKAEEFNKDYMHRLGDTICPLPNAIETVQALRGKVKQYIVTNGLVASQVKKLSNSGLDKLVDGVFISEEIGYDKPSKEFFNAVISSIGDVKRSEILMVGDSLATDMQGGNNAGLVCCWFNPKHKENNRGLKIDYEVDDLSLIPGLDILYNV